MSKHLGPDGFHINAIATATGTKPITQVAERYVLATLDESGKPTTPRPPLRCRKCGTESRTKPGFEVAAMLCTCEDPPVETRPSKAGEAQATPGEPWRVELGTYRHYRTGNLYTVILNTIAHHDQDGVGVPRVIYVGHYLAKDGESRPYDCTAKHFLEWVEHKGKHMRRFERVGG